MNPTIADCDVLLIGSGVMSSNLGALLKSLEPSFRVEVYEVSERLASESSDGWNNAGTGHAGLCELSYTPHREADGTVNIANAAKIFAQFEQSKQFWSYAVESGMIDHPAEFIRPVPHLSFVHGKPMVEYLEARFQAMAAHPFFAGMEYSADRETIASWAPLLLDGRQDVPIAATRAPNGTDVDFGAVSRKLLDWLSRQNGCTVATRHRVTSLKKSDGLWHVAITDLSTGRKFSRSAKFVFIGAGGGSLPLLQKSGIPEARGLGGFPIGGQWLICENPEIVNRHQAKVYGQPLDSAPTMAVPHLDTRVLDGKKTLLFGPFAAWTTKFLHQKGSPLDLPLSVKPHNLATLIKIGIHNLDLVKYLVQQGTQSMADRMEVLHVFYPGAKKEDWKLIDAGIRVQAIKKTDGEAGIVHYGTEVITDADRTLSALLGASPGASVSVNIVLEVVRSCFQHLLDSPEKAARLSQMIPTWDIDPALEENRSRFERIRSHADSILGLSLTPPRDLAPTPHLP